MLVSLVTPSTSVAISSPKRSVTSSLVTVVSSTTSCSSAAAIVARSISSSARISATASGCSMYDSPEARSCPRCAPSATAKTCSSHPRSRVGSYWLTLAASWEIVIRRLY